MRRARCGRGGAGPWLGLCLLALVACASSRPAAEPRRVLLLPLNVVADLPAHLEPGRDSVAQVLQAYLASHSAELSVLDPAQARAAWLAAAHDLREEQGAQAMSFDGAARLLAISLRRDHEFDWLVVPWIALRRAKVRGRTVSWDGVTRSMRVSGETRGMRLVLKDFQQQAAAPSLQVAVLAPDGRLLFQGAGGLDVTHSLVIVPGQPPRIDAEPLPPEQVLSDHANLREGIARAFDPLLPAP